MNNSKAQVSFFNDNQLLGMVQSAKDFDAIEVILLLQEGQEVTLLNPSEEEVR